MDIDKEIYKILSGGIISIVDTTDGKKIVGIASASEVITAFIENLLEQEKKRLLETHTVKEENRHRFFWNNDTKKWVCDVCGALDGKISSVCSKKEEPTTPEKKCCDKDAICNKCAIQTSSYEVTCGGNEKIRKCDCGGPPKTNHSAACAIFR